MKKIFALLLAAMMLLAATGCNSDTPSSSDTPSQPQDSQPESTEWAPITPGVLTVGTSADFAPYEFHIIEDGKDKIVGFDMELAQYIADELGLELKIVDMSFESLLIELDLGTIDMVIAGLSPDPERDIYFSDTYYMGTQCLMVNKTNLDKYTALADLNDPQYSVGAQTGSIQADLAADNTPNASQVLLTDIPTIIMELKSGTIDAAYMETVVAEGYVDTQDDLAIIFEVPYDADGNCVGIKKGDDDLLAKVNAILAKVESEGKMAEWVTTAMNLSAQEVG